MGVYEISEQVGECHLVTLDLWRSAEIFSTTRSNNFGVKNGFF